MDLVRGAMLRMDFSHFAIPLTADAVLSVHEFVLRLYDPKTKAIENEPAIQRVRLCTVSQRRLAAFPI